MYMLLIMASPDSLPVGKGNLIPAFSQRKSVLTRYQVILAAIPNKAAR